MTIFSYYTCFSRLISTSYYRLRINLTTSAPFLFSHYYLWHSFDIYFTKVLYIGSLLFLHGVQSLSLTGDKISNSSAEFFKTFSMILSKNLIKLQRRFDRYDKVYKRNSKIINQNFRRFLIVEQLLSVIDRQVIIQQTNFNVNRN